MLTELERGRGVMLTDKEFAIVMVANVIIAVAVIAWAVKQLKGGDE